MLEKQKKLLEIIDSQQCRKVGSRWFSNNCQAVDAQCPAKNTNALEVLENLKAALKTNAWLYYKLVSFLGPVLPDRKAIMKIRHAFSDYNHQSAIVNLGSGPSVFFGRSDIINIDIYPYENVDIISSGENLPIKSGTVDLLINIAMLEHTPKPADTIREMARILKPGGVAIVFVPFLQPYHAAPSDFTRWTKRGAAEIFSDFKEVDVCIGAGPTSSLLWILQHWIALFFSLGIKPIHDVIFVLLMLITFPVKYLDYLMVLLPGAETISSGFYIFAKK